MNNTKHSLTAGCQNRMLTGHTVKRSLILLTLFTAPALISTGGIQLFGAETSESGSETTLSHPGGDGTDSSPVIGGGVRHPPDIGAAGTGTVQDPIHSESPTDEPSIVPPITPPVSGQPGTIESQLPKEPLGHPEVFSDGKQEPVPEPGLNK